MDDFFPIFDNAGQVIIKYHFISFNMFGYIEM